MDMLLLQVSMLLFLVGAVPCYIIHDNRFSGTILESNNRDNRVVCLCAGQKATQLGTHHLVHQTSLADWSTSTFTRNNPGSIPLRRPLFSRMFFAFGSIPGSDGKWNPFISEILRWRQFPRNPSCMKRTVSGTQHNSVGKGKLQFGVYARCESRPECDRSSVVESSVVSYGDSNRCVCGCVAASSWLQRRDDANTRRVSGGTQVTGLVTLRQQPSMSTLLSAIPANPIARV